MPTALITGINGQDGSYLSELLLERGYEVHGTIRRSSTISTERIDHIFDPEDRRYIHYADLEEGLEHLLYDIKPDEIYNLAAMSHVKVSFDVPVYTAMTNAVGVVKLLEAVRKLHLKSRIYQASSSEMFGITPPPQSEDSPFNPVSPYGCAKLYAYHIARSYRTGYGMFVSNGILFNHESERRGESFVTKKIVNAAVRIKHGLQDKLYLGNLDAKRDWGHSRDYMRAVMAILGHSEPGDFVVATGETHTVREFVERVFSLLGMDWEKHVEIQESLRRPNEVPALLGDSTKIRKVLGWKPKIDFNTLISRMVSDAENRLHIRGI
jgi:GDPmannose 4,6-dehydratase